MVMVLVEWVTADIDADKDAGKKGAFCPFFM